MKKLIIKNSIRKKLLLTMMGIVVALLVALTYIQISSQMKMMEKELGNRIILMKDKLHDKGLSLSYNLNGLVQSGIAAFNFSNITEILQKSIQDEKELSYAILMDSSRLAYVDTLKPELEQGILSAKEDIFAAKQLKQAINEYEENGLSYIEFISPIKVSTEPWGVLRLGFSLEYLNQEITKSQQEISEQIRNMIIQSVITSIIFIFLATGLIILLSNRLTKPLIHLTEQADKLAQGNFSEGNNIQFISDDEIGLLGASFARMSRDLKASYEKLEDHSRTLEQQVEIRTKELEEAKDLAVSANRSKSDFLSMMSHEIRTPMNAIIGMNYLALRTELTEKQHDYITKAQSAAQSLLGIINDILDFSKIEAGKLDFECIEFNLENVLNNLATIMTIKTEEKGLEMCFDISMDVPFHLVGDPTRIGQVLLNLANNALKFTESGAIVIKVEKLAESNNDDETTLKFTVKDTGIGLSKQQIGRLFQSFSQADVSTTRKYGGTGLGLTICKRLVNMMGGEIWVESEPNKGSSFIFTIKSKQNKNRQRYPLIYPEELRGLKVLVVDDSAFSREILRSLLESFSSKVTVASSGKEAIMFLESTPADDPFKLVLMDWRMPQMDGIQAARLIQENTKIDFIPTVIMVTAHSREEVIRNTEEAKLDGFLIKPVHVSLLYNTIIEIFNNKSLQREPISASKFVQKTGLEKIKGAKILLVEDNAINQQVATEILSSAELNVTIANNGKEAVSKVKEMQFDAVLMDLQMPEMDGYEATRLIRGDEKFKDLPIIAMTAHAMASEKEKCIKLGMNDHATKPIEPEKLFKILAHWVKPNANIKPERNTFPNTSSVIKTETEDCCDIPEQIPGIDMKRAMQNVMGNKSLYREILAMFYNQHFNLADELRDSLKKDNKNNASGLAHLLKGVASNLGAMDLSSHASNLEKAINENHTADIRDLLNTCEVSLKEIMASIKSIMDTSIDKKIANESEPYTEFDLDKARPFLVELHQLLREKRFSANDFFTQNKHLLNGAALKQETEELEAHLMKFDMDAAVGALELIGKKLNFIFEESCDERQ